MSFWVAVVIIVLMLEAVRICLSSFLLLHILRGLQPPAERSPDGLPPGWFRERDRLASEAMVAVRGAIEGLARPDGGVPAEPAIRALDAYVLHHQEAGPR